jgi:hypothetical protein
MWCVCIFLTRTVSSVYIYIKHTVCVCVCDSSPAMYYVHTCIRTMCPIYRYLRATHKFVVRMMVSTMGWATALLQTGIAGAAPEDKFHVFTSFLHV